MKAKDSKGDKNGIIHVKNTAEAVRYLSEKEGNIFLTTGSKELEAFLAVTDFENRIYARVLPSPAVVEKCVSLGLKGNHIIASRGLFQKSLIKL